MQSKQHIPNIKNVPSNQWEPTLMAYFVRIAEAGCTKVLSDDLLDDYVDRRLPISILNDMRDGVVKELRVGLNETET